MNVAPVIVRELRAESRRPLNYWLRALGAGALLLACYFALSSHANFMAMQRSYAEMLRRNPGRGWGGGPVVLSDPQGIQAAGSLLFGNANAALFLTLWVLVPLLAADSISREKREGTLGLLFLTPLTPTGVVTGKCFVHGVRALTLFLTMLPILTLPMLLGGISPADVFMAVLLDANALILALAAGLLASCVGRDPVRTIILAEALSLLFAAIFMSLHQWSFSLIGGPQVLAGGMSSGALGVPGRPFFGGRGDPGSGVLSWLMGLLEFNTDLATSERNFFGGPTARVTGLWSDFWAAAKAAEVAAWFRIVAGLTGLSLLSFWAVLRLAAGFVGRCWREEPPSPEVEKLRKIWCEPRFWMALFRRKRTHALERNPISWLQQYSLHARLTKWGWCLFVVLTESVLAVGWDEMSAAQVYLAAALLGGVAFTAASSFRQDRESGGLELLLVTPLQPWQLMTGRLRGVWMQFLPAVIMLSCAWLFAERSLNVGRMWMDRGSSELRAPILLLSSFLSLPVVGLFSSLVRRTLVGAWIQSCLLNFGVPFLLAWALRAVGESLGVPPRSPGPSLFPLIAAQVVTAVVAALLLPGRLRRVAMAESKA